MATPLSTTTVGTAIGRILSKLSITKPVDQIKRKALIQLNNAQKEIWDEITKNPEIENLYTVETADPIALALNIFNLSSISDYQKVIGLRRNGWGKVNPTDKETIEELANDEYAKKEIYYTVYGDTLKIFIGSSLSQLQNNFYLKYVRLCIPLVNLTDKLDVPDGFEDKLINKVVLSIGGVPPTPEAKEKK